MNPEKYVIKNGNTAVHFLQRLLDEDINKQRKDLRNLLQANNGICFNAPMRDNYATLGEKHEPIRLEYMSRDIIEFSFS